MSETAWKYCSVPNWSSVGCVWLMVSYRYHGPITSISCPPKQSQQSKYQFSLQFIKYRVGSAFNNGCTVGFIHRIKSWYLFSHGVKGFHQMLFVYLYFPCEKVQHFDINGRETDIFSHNQIGLIIIYLKMYYSMIAHSANKLLLFTVLVDARMKRTI